MDRIKTFDDFMNFVNGQSGGATAEELAQLEEEERARLAAEGDGEQKGWSRQRLQDRYDEQYASNMAAGKKGQLKSRGNPIPKGFRDAVGKKRFVKEDGGEERGELGPQYLKLAKKNARISRAKAFEELVRLKEIPRTSAQLRRFGQKDARWELDIYDNNGKLTQKTKCNPETPGYNLVATQGPGRTGAPYGFGRKFMSKAGATRALNKELEDRYQGKPLHRKLGARKRDMCNSSKYLSATTSYKQNPIGLDFQGVDDGSRCKKLYKQKANKRKTRKKSAWDHYLNDNKNKYKTLKVAMIELGKLWRAKCEAE